jgi:internalin A
MLALTSVSGQGMAHLAKLSNLTRLDLGGTRVTNRGLLQLAELPRLQELKIGNPGVTSDGLVAINRMPNLRELNLVGSMVDQKILSHSTDLQRLTDLWVPSDMSFETLRELTNAVPGLRIHFNPSTPETREMQRRLGQ